MRRRSLSNAMTSPQVRRTTGSVRMLALCALLGGVLTATTACSNTSTDKSPQIVSSSSTTSAAPSTPGQSAAERLNEPGPEAKRLAALTGTFDVVATMWPTPGSAPMVTKDLVAERKMVGILLQETIQPSPGSQVSDFQRIDYLQYSRVEGRWQYVSMDTRLPVGIMPAYSFGAEDNSKVSLQFQPIAFVGFGQQVDGKMMRSDMVISWSDNNSQTKQQHFIQADGTGTSWLAVQYEYTRRS
ncbi:DUF1579 domain-containing protein [Nocardia gamkensis]|uniref:DUF1579 domain-containing protein n=1 Tax=Nocardia gamkensis TaxID=352869 RepID=A0A7X6LBL0_9NOCA|nr:DUF1579 domain-containing protein [Nocardia gamkensis]NKY31318.1 DUF1579 domain-containing protein [Nocardia gamkensis]